MHQRLFYAMLFASLFIFTRPTMARADTEIQVVKSDYSFGEKLFFGLQVRSTQAIKNGTVFFGEADGTTTGVVPLTITHLGEDAYQLQVAVDLTSIPLRSFSKINYHFEAALEDGTNIRTPDYNFDYLDNRFEWKMLERNKFRVYWYERDTAFGQSILDVAEKSLDRIQTIFGESEIDHTDFYIYNTFEDFSKSLPPNHQEWSAGYSDPALGIVVVPLPDGPDQVLVTEQRIPHELMHIQLAKITGGRQVNLPIWLEEGLASSAELYPNPDYALVIQNAQEKDGLIPISSLCLTFPRDTSNAFLAYAQSASFVRFLHDRFGTSGLEKLFEAYMDGLDCENGVFQTFGADFTQLERQWRVETLGENSITTATSDLSPWLVLVLAILAAPLIVFITSLFRKTSSNTL